MVVLIFAGDLKYCPYIERYIERLESKQIEYSVLFWNRGGFHFDLPENYYYFDYPSRLKQSKVTKLFDFLHFRKWVLSTVAKLHCEKVIFLSTFSGVLFFDIAKKYKKRFILDIRDYSYEFFAPYRYIENEIIKNSYFTAISSKGFREFLPKEDYVIAHNFNRKDFKPGRKKAPCQDPIHIVWNGVMRYFDFQRQYIDALANDERFLLIYNGDGPDLDQYISYCNARNIKNVHFSGSYDNDDKSKLLNNADLLNNCYGYMSNAGCKLKYAVSNKFYDGIMYHIPQLVEPEGFKTDWVTGAGVGTSIKIDSCFADLLFDYCHSIPESFDTDCDNLLHEIVGEDDQYIQSINLFLEL